MSRRLPGDVSRRIIMSLWFVGVVSLAITSPRDRRISLILLAVFGGVMLLNYLARKNPDAAWVYWLWGWEMGPRTNAPTMSRYDLRRSGVRFLLYALVLLGLLIATGHFGFRGAQDSMVALALLFVLSLGFLMCTAAGLYLLIRGVLKKGL